MFGFKKTTISGIVFIAILAFIAINISSISIIKKLGFSSLVIGIIIGMVVGNLFHHKLPISLNEGITFSAKKILRLAIILYGFRLTFQDIAKVGIEGALVSIIMLSTTLILGVLVGQKIFKLPKDSAILTASGASVCGAAAVLATESVVKAKESSVAVAVSMVVLFGTISMFLYPILYEAFIKDPNSIFYLNPAEFGIYVGGSVHEVAQVVAIPASIPNAPEVMAHNAVIVKMTRVLLIAPMLIILGVILSLNSSSTTKATITIPWFAIYFIIVVAFNSLELLPLHIVEIINKIDTFLLTMAMTALGVGTIFSKFKSVGVGAFYTALIMFFWLVIGGFIVTKTITSLF